MASSAALSHFTENNIDLPQNLTTSRLELQPTAPLEPPANFVSKEVKNLNTFENSSQSHSPQVIVKSENHQIHAEQSELKFRKKSIFVGRKTHFLLFQK